jgi:hypothetical protein
MVTEPVDETLEERRLRKDAEKDALEQSLKGKLPELLAAAYIPGRFFEEHGKKKWRSDAHDVTVNLERGRWRVGGEETGKKHYSLVELIKLLRDDRSARDTANWLRGKLQGYGVVVRAKREYRRARWPIPPGHMEPWLKKGLQIDSPEFWARFSVPRAFHLVKVWTYPGSEEPHFYVARFEDDSGEKTFRQLAWFGDVEGWGLVTKASPLGRELLPLGHFELERRPDADVLVVEGEKTYDAAVGLFPGKVVLTWYGGVEAVLSTDWSGLRRRRVLLLPDHDQKGLSAMRLLQGRLYQAGNATAALVPIEDWRLPAKWKDVADGDPSPELPLAQLVSRIEHMEALPADIRYIHERVALVGTITGDPFYLITERDPVTGRTVRTRLSQFSRVKEVYAHVPSFTVDPDRPKSAPKRTNAVEKWQTYEGKRIYARTYLDPARTHDGDYLNMWEGYTAKGLEAHQLVYTGLDPRVLPMLKDALCPDDPTMARYLVRYLARLVQCPTARCDVALVLVGLEGTGKTFFGQMVQNLFHPDHSFSYGQHDQATSQFNDELENKLVVVYDEALYGRKKGDQDYLKTLITGRELTIEGKGQARRRVPNYLHVVVLSNSQAPVQAGKDARRYVVLRTPDKFAGPAGQEDARRHFGTLMRLLYEEGQLEQLIAWLLRLPVNKFELTRIPQSRGLRQVKAEREDTVLDFLIGRLVGEGWAVEPVLRFFHEDFVKYCDLVGLQKMSIKAFRRELQRLLPLEPSDLPAGVSDNVQKRLLETGCYLRKGGGRRYPEYVRRLPPRAAAAARLAVNVGVTPAELGLDGVLDWTDEPVVTREELPDDLRI